MKKGYLVIESLLAAALFVVFASAMVIAVIGSWNANRMSKEQITAVHFASEGIEAARSIRNQSYATLASPTGTVGVANSVGNLREWSGTSNTFDGRYTRTITVEEVNRDGSGNIVPAPTGTLDTNTKKVTSTVNWNFSAAKPADVSLSTYLTNWKAVMTPGFSPMMVYSKTTAVPYYRVWDGSNWGEEAAAQTVGGDINYVVLKAARTRNEVILGTLDSGGNIYAQVWDGSTWGTPELMASVTATNATTQSFDIAYEKSGDRAIMAYLPNSTSVDFAYRIWNGSSWSDAVTVTTPPTTGVVKWIKLAASPLSGSDEIALLMLDANIDVYGMAWNGITWGNMGAATVWDATASIATKKAIDVAYEQNSGEALFIWGDSVSTDQYYRTWNGSSLTGPTLLDIPAAGGVAHWVNLAARPDSDEILYGVVDAGADLNTRKWSGTAWDTVTQHAEHSGAVENITSMVFDIIWETHTANSGKAWLLWGNGSTVSTKQWSGTAWGSASILTGTDDTSFIRLNAVPGTGEIFAGVYESRASARDDILEFRLTGGGTTWTAKNTLWGGPTSAEPVYFRIDMVSR